MSVQEDSKSAAPAAGGWGADFLKQNAAAQASQSADIAKEIVKKQGGTPQPARASPTASSQGLGKGVEAKDAPSGPEPVGSSATPAAHVCTAWLTSVLCDVGQSGKAFSFIEEV